MPVPELQKPAPKFAGTAVVNGAFKEIKLEDYAGKYLVLFFYPLDFTFVCPTEIIAFSDRVEEFKKIGCEVIGVSTDSHFTHLAWINTPRKQGGLGELGIPLLVDETLRLVQAFQFTDEHGEVCPANWKPGSKTMVADPQKSKEYFSAAN